MRLVVSPEERSWVAMAVAQAPVRGRVEREAASEVSRALAALPEDGPAELVLSCPAAAWLVASIDGAGAQGGAWMLAARIEGAME